MRLSFQLIVSVTLLVGIVGCGSMPKGPIPNDPEFAPIEPSRLVEPGIINGAIYQHHYAVSFFEDRKARRIGDILTVNLVEQTSAVKETETEIKKESSSAIPEPNVLGKNNIGLATTLDSQVEFKGEADSDQSNSLEGSITVTVTDVYPNGVMRIRGEKWIRLNKGDEYIRISGLVRPEDIGEDNSVNSTRVADARIAYSQTGDMANANQMGWLTRFFNHPIWPF